jgi:hypothetical protein
MAQRKQMKVEMMYTGRRPNLRAKGMNRRQPTDKPASIEAFPLSKREYEIPKSSL